ncbi:endothelial cell-specific molecule 1 isoform X1 [Rousettus aegyptiacus]|uniref:endothelial cell-specific molecule 1 isoform X1 n=1 Tax=Rousettus aegyptiacus TaxID=9407 RepID=UPI00168CB739|nr:endothelial cell-specific molecule 1 isoform X1 [Rousettus aegyptiacus]
MKSVLLLATLLVPAHLATAWSSKYAVDCPERCDSNECKSSLRCKRTVLDDCGCCRVCAAGLGETCYRTVSGMDGVKCGPGLRCQFYSEEDDFGDEFGICKDCPYGTFGMECKETCNCQLGICDRVTGKCLKFPFFQYSVAKSSNRRFVSHTEHDMASGDGNAVRELVNENAARSPVMKWGAMTPRSNRKCQDCVIIK